MKRLFEPDKNKSAFDVDRLKYALSSGITLSWRLTMRKCRRRSIARADLASIGIQVDEAVYLVWAHFKTHLPTTAVRSPGFMVDIHLSSHNMPAQSNRVGTVDRHGNSVKAWKQMGKPQKRNWSKVRQAFKDALPESSEFNRVDCLNLLMFLAHNPNEELLIQELELRLPDLGPKVESIVSKLIALGLVKNSRQHGTQLSSKAIELMSAPPKDDAE